MRELGGGPALRVAPAVLAERVTDLLGVAVLLAVGALAFPGGAWWAALGLAAVAAGVAVFTWEPFAAWLFRWVARLPVAGPRAGAGRLTGSRSWPVWRSYVARPSAPRRWRTSLT